MRFNTGFDRVHPVKELVFNPEEDMTEQQHAIDCDINHIVRNYDKVMFNANPSVSPLSGDFTPEFNYHDAMIKIAKAQQEFELLPSNIRKYFDNDPGKLLEFIDKEENRDEAIRLGLVQRPTSSAVGSAVSTTSGSTDGQTTT